MENSVVCLFSFCAPPPRSPLLLNRPPPPPPPLHSLSPVQFWFCDAASVEPSLLFHGFPAGSAASNIGLPGLAIVSTTMSLFVSTWFVAPVLRSPCRCARRDISNSTFVFCCHTGVIMQLAGPGAGVTTR